MTVVLLGLLAEYTMAVAVCRRTGVFISMYMDTVEGCFDCGDESGRGDDVSTEGSGLD